MHLCVLHELLKSNVLVDICLYRIKILFVNFLFLFFHVDINLYPTGINQIYLTSSLLVAVFAICCGW